MIRILAVSLCFLLSFALAQESTGFVEEDAHEHGVAQLNIAQDAENLFVEFISPSINIVGFEYQPSTEEEKTLVETALSDLEAGLILFSPSESASCQLLSVSVESEIAGETHKEDHHGEEHGEEGHHDEEHGEEEHSEDGHYDEDHAEEEHDHDEEHSEDGHHDEDHAEDGHHDHEEGEHDDDEASTHSEFHANYELSCANIDELSGFDLSGLFALYPAIADLDVQYALESGQGAAELNAESTQLAF